MIKMGMNFYRKLPIPKEIKAQYSLTAEMEQVKKQRAEEIKKVFTGESDKFILVIGPCSADHKDPVLEYISRLRLVEDKVKDKIIIIPRIYTNKPRTTGEGYKGMLHQPDPETAPDMLKGIISIRDLHLSALRDYGFTCADEMLSRKSSLSFGFVGVCSGRRAFYRESATPPCSKRYRRARRYEKPNGR